MGRAARWLRSILGLGKKAAPPAEIAATPPAARERKRWGSFVKSFREKDKMNEAVLPVAASCGNRDSVDEDEEQNKRAIAVAAATAAVAEAAVAAAQAAAAVVRLTSSGRVHGGVGKREEWASVKIQAAFRAYLARRALRALRGLVKLQALVRGNIVRKQAAETLRCMQALVRVQARARACRALRSNGNQLKLNSRTHAGPATPEKSEQPIRSNVRKPERSSPLKRNSSKPTRLNDGFDQDRVQSSESRWLDHWMEDRFSWDTSRSSMVPMSVPLDDEKNAKILEIDTGKPHYNSKRKSSNYMHYSCSPLASDQFSHSFTTVPNSPSKDSTVVQRSIPSPSSVDMQQSLSPLSFPIVDGFNYGESPQFFSASSRPASSRGPFTPSKSECSRSLFSGYSDYPNYMANTESSRAKVRSHSAPKQRPEFEKLGSIRRVSGGHGFGQQSGSAALQKSSSSSLHSKFTNKNYPGSGRLDRLGMPLGI